MVVRVEFYIQLNRDDRYTHSIQSRSLQRWLCFRQLTALVLTTKQVLKL